MSLHYRIRLGRNRQHIIYIILNESHLFSYISFPWQVEHVHYIVNHHSWDKSRQGLEAPLATP